MTTVRFTPGMQQQRRDEVTEFDTFAGILHEMHIALHSHLATDGVWACILHQIERIAQPDATIVLLTDGDDAQVAVARGRTPHLAATLLGERVTIAETPQLAYMLRTGQPLLLADATRSPLYRSMFTGLEPMQAYLGVPLRVRDDLIGFINLMSTSSGSFTGVSTRLLLAFAESAALALHNARRCEQAQTEAIQAERHRLARDLHDGVSQTLFSANMLADSLPYLWGQQSPIIAEKLHKLRQLTRTAFAEMRTVLLELRSEATADVALETLLHQLVAAHAGLTTAQIELDCAPTDALQPPVTVRAVFYRVAQEALNNAVQHAAATAIEVRLRHADNRVDLLIRDDGKGFDTRQPGPTHFGLKIMQERARQIGALLRLTSAARQGTTVHMIWSTEDKQEGGGTS